MRVYVCVNYRETLSTDISLKGADGPENVFERETNCLQLSLLPVCVCVRQACHNTPHFCELKGQTLDWSRRGE